jgi:hypothetical protein
MNRFSTVFAIALVVGGVANISGVGWAAGPDNNPKPLKQSTIYQDKKTGRIDNRIKRPDQRLNQDNTPAPVGATPPASVKSGATRTSRPAGLSGANDANAKPESPAETDEKKVTASDSTGHDGSLSGGKKDTRPGATSP